MDGRTHKRRPILKTGSRVEGWMDGQTDAKRLARLPCRGKSINQDF